MTSGQKTALSLLISVVLFCAFSLAAFAGLFSAIDARFYEPAKIAGIRSKLNDVSSAADEWLNALAERFALGESSFLKNSSVKSFVEAKPGEEDALSRSELLGELRSSTQGFLGLRVLDKNLNSLHFSTFHSDILRRDEKNNLTAYKNYLDCLSPSGEQEISAQTISCSDTSGDLAAAKKIYFDKENRIVFSFPLYDKYSVFRGTAIFYVNALDLSNLLLKRGLLSIGQDFAFLSNGRADEGALYGYVFGIPSVGQAGQEEFKKSLLDAWQNPSSGIRRLFAIDEKQDDYWVALSERSQSGIFACGVYNDQIFSLSFSARALILACVFVSIFLICFLLLNLRRDDETVIRERIKSLQLGVVDEYLAKKEALDWEAISGRRDAVTKEIIHSLGRRAKKRPEQVEALISRSWDELFAAMNLRPKGSGEGGLENAQEIKAMLQEILSSGAIKVQSVAAPASPASAAPVSTPAAPARPQVSASPAPAAVEDVEEVEEAEALEEVEELEDVAAAEPVEDLEEVDEVEDAEAVEDLEEIEDAEPVEEAEPADAEAVEDLEEVEEVEEAEAVEPVEEVEEAEAVEPVEALEEIEEAQPAEDVAAAEAVEDLEEVEEVGDAEAVEPAEEVENLEELEDAESNSIDDDVLSLLAADSDESLSASKHSPDEMYDISEVVGADFFALHEKREAQKNSAEVSRDESLDHFFTVRDAFEPNDETEALAQNFSIAQPNFSELDAGGAEVENEPKEKEISLEDFGIQQNKEKEEFSERLEFGAPVESAHDDGFDVASTFTTEKPKFERAPFATFSGPKKAAAEDDSQNAADIIPLSNGEGFTFSSFGKGFGAAASDLQSADYSAIVQDSNGVFSITEDLQTSDVAQDNSFKSLVDSVLNNA